MRLVWLALGILSVALSSCRGSAPPPHLILIVIDTLRADHVGAYGYARPTTPHMDALARDGLRFTRAFAPSSWTRPSVGSLFTSRLPSEHGAVSFAQGLDPASPTLAENLRQAGYRTVGVSANFVHVSESAGFARGFETWASSGVVVEPEDPGVMFTIESGGGAAVRFRAWRGAEVNREVLAALGRGDRRPLFLYVHYMEPHSPYAPPERERLAFRRSAATPVRASNDTVIAAASGRSIGIDPAGLVDLYDAEIAAADDAVGALLAELQRRGLLANAVLVVASDHGEELGDHGGWFHALTLHREVLSVPLVLRDLRTNGPGGVRDDPVDLLDVPVTLLGLAGIHASPGMRGRDLLRAVEPRELVAQLHPDPPFEKMLGPRRHRVALVAWPWKVIGAQDGTRQVYQLEQDPTEVRGSDPAASGAASALAERLTAFDPGGASPAAPAVLDETTREGLRALGYLR
jgi:arylsulfatase A-like enzyme